jgi:hypothetical protein
MSNRILRATLLVALVAVATACTSVSKREEAMQAAQPPRLLSAGTLDLPGDCAVVPGAVYRADFVVGANGAVESVSAGSGPECARDALASWVRTFRYQAGTSPSTTTIDWMAVVARR